MASSTAAGCCIRRTAVRSPIRWASSCPPASRRWQKPWRLGSRLRQRRAVAGEAVRPLDVGTRRRAAVSAAATHRPPEAHAAPRARPRRPRPICASARSAISRPFLRPDVGTHEGQGRNIITAPGTNGMLLPGNCKILLGRLPGDAKAAIKPHEGLAGEWQQIEIIVRGNTMIHMLNGQVMSITVDDDPVAHRWASFRCSSRAAARSGTGTFTSRDRTSRWTCRNSARALRERRPCQSESNPRITKGRLASGPLVVIQLWSWQRFPRKTDAQGPAQMERRFRRPHSRPLVWS